MTGKLVFNHSVGLQEGQNQIPLSLQNLSKGIYMLMIKDENSQILKQIKVFKD